MAKPQDKQCRRTRRYGSRRDPAGERMGELVEKHLRKACDLNDIDIYELPEVIGPAARCPTDCAFGGCLRDGDRERRQPVRRLSQAARLEGNRHEPRLHRGAAGLGMSLHEVSDVRPEREFPRARPRSRRRPDPQGLERTATKTLVTWDIIAARIVTVRRVVQMTGAVLLVDRDLAEEMLELFRRTRRRCAPGMTAETFGAAVDLAFGGPANSKPNWPARCAVLRRGRRNDHDHCG